MWRGLFITLLLLGLSKYFVEAQCDNGWSFGFNQCYKVFRGPQAGTFTGRTVLAPCDAYGADLAVIHSPKENAFVHDLHSKCCATYIGLNDIEQNYKWIWTDGTLLRYDNFASGQPTNDGNIQHHATMEGNGQWWDRSAQWANEVNRDFVCQKPSTIPPKQVTAAFTLLERQKRSATQVLRTSIVRSVIRCMQLCTRLSRCISFNTCDSDEGLLCEMTSDDYFTTRQPSASCNAYYIGAKSPPFTHDF